MRLIRFCLLCVVSLTISSCILDNPVSEESEPSEFEYNYWLLSHWYLYPEEIQDISDYGKNTSTLYKSLSDPYTQYIPPSISDETSDILNTSVVTGDIGLEILLNTNSEYPLFIYRVYPSSPASKAGIKRYSTITSINGIELKSTDAYSIYQKELSTNKNITLTVLKENEIFSFSLTKANIYTPTVFLDTINGVLFITIKTFKPNTLDSVNGSFGELRSILEQTKDASLRVLDLRDNLGGHLNQCINMADLFVSKGILSSHNSMQVNADGETYLKKTISFANEGDVGEQGDFLFFVNKNTASCAEIFTAAVTENRSFLIIGEKTYGKGVGQNTWKTKENGLAIITSMVFETPNGFVYNEHGIKPDILCDKADYNCLFDYLQNGSSLLTKKKNAFWDSFIKPTSSQKYSFSGTFVYFEKGY